MQDTTFEHELEIRNLTDEDGISDIDDIALGSILPLIIEDAHRNVVQVIFCETISGGQNSTDGLPNELELTTIIKDGNKLVKNIGKYVLQK